MVDAEWNAWYNREDIPGYRTVPDVRTRDASVCWKVKSTSATSPHRSQAQCVMPR
jgi:hypothetical protein